jgi:hypothetical protein
LLGAIDRTGLAYEWTPYPWRPLGLIGSSWHGLLPAPPLLGIYQLQLRLDGRTLLTSPHWLLHVFARGTMSRRSFPTAVAAIRDFVAHLAGNQQLVALRQWPRVAFDHRDPRLQRLFVIAYAPRGDQRPASRRGLFVTTVRDGFRGRWDSGQRACVLGDRASRDCRAGRRAHSQGVSQAGHGVQDH